MPAMPISTRKHVMKKLFLGYPIFRQTRHIPLYPRQNGWWISPLYMSRYCCLCVKMWQTKHACYHLGMVDTGSVFWSHPGWFAFGFTTLYTGQCEFKSACGGQCQRQLLSLFVLSQWCLNTFFYFLFVLVSALVFVFVLNRRLIRGYPITTVPVFGLRTIKSNRCLTWLSDHHSLFLCPAHNKI